MKRIGSVSGVRQCGGILTCTAITFWACAFTWLTLAWVRLVVHEAGRTIRHALPSVHPPLSHAVLIKSYSLGHFPTLVLCNTSPVPKLKFMKKIILT